MKKNKSINLFNYVSKDKNRASLVGVYHSNGFKVATDSHILVAKKESYSDDKEGKIINKKGEVIDAKFPKYECVIPNLSKISWGAYKKYNIDIPTVEEFVKKAKKDGFELSRYCVKIGEAFFYLDKFNKLLAFMQSIGTNILWVSADGLRASLTYREDSKDYIHDEVGLLMPCYIRHESDLKDGFLLKLA